MSRIAEFRRIVERYRPYWAVDGGVMAAIGTVAIITLAARVISFGREFIVASTFGTGDALEAFLVALAVPSFAINVVGASFNSALLPTYIKVRDGEGFAGARGLLGNVSCVAAVLLLTTMLVLAAAGPSLLEVLAPGFLPPKLALTKQLFFILLPAVGLSGLSTTWGAILTAHAKYSAAPWAQILAAVCPVVFLLCLNRQFGIYALAWGTLAGCILETAALRFGALRIGHRSVFRWTGFDSQTRMVLREYAPMVLAALASSSSPLVDQAMAARLGAGNIAALSYASKPVALVCGVGALALGSAILPYFSGLSAARNWRQLRQALTTYSGLLIAVSLPVVLAVTLLSREIVSVLYGRGAFSAHDVNTVGDILAAYSLQIPAYLLSIVGVRLLSALNENRTILYIAMFNVIVNIVGDYVLMQFWGALGIALATSLVYVISTCLVFVRVVALLNRRMRGDGER